MGVTKCVVCVKKRGKRLCQINNNTLICPVCCAKSRNSNCAGCRYYAEAESYARQKGQTAIKLADDNFVMRIDPQAENTVDAALALAERGNISAALTALNELHQKNPDIATVKYGMGVIHLMRDQYNVALPYFEAAIEIFPLFAEAWLNKAYCHQKRGEFEKFFICLRKAVEYGDPEEPAFVKASSAVRDIGKRIQRDTGLTLDDYMNCAEKFDTAFAIMERGEWQKALEMFQEIIAIYPAHVQTHGNMGLCYAYLEQKTEAFAAYDRALALDPNYQPARTNRATLLQLPEGKRLSENKNVVWSKVRYYEELFVAQAREQKQLFQKTPKKLGGR